MLKISPLTDFRVHDRRWNLFALVVVEEQKVVVVVYFGFVQTESGQVLYTTALLQLNQLFIYTMISYYNQGVANKNNKNAEHYIPPHLL